MRRLRFGILTLLLVAFAHPLHAQVPDAAKFAPIKARMQKFVDDGDLSGAVTVVGNKSGVLHFEAVGQRDIESKSAMTKNAVFKIASMTKPITAMAIMILQDEGKLSVEDPVEKHLPEFKGQWLVAAKEKDSITLKNPSRVITLRDLLTHTSGLPSSYPGGFADVYVKRNRTLAETTLMISQQPLQFEPGTKWAYCNAGIDTLGRIVEVVSGETFEGFLQQRLFSHLKMNDTRFYPIDNQMKRLASLYNKVDGKLVPVKGSILEAPAEAKHPVPAGGLYSTGADLAKLYRMMLNKGEFEGKRYLSEKAVEQMTKVQTGVIETGFVPGMSYGFGFAVVREPKGVTEMLSPGTYGHGGAFGTQGWIDPTQDLFCILLIQRQGLQNGDASPMRKELQALAVAAIKN